MKLKRISSLLLIIFVFLVITAVPVFSWQVTDLDGVPSVIPADGQSSSTITTSLINTETGEPWTSYVFLSTSLGIFEETGISRIYSYQEGIAQLTGTLISENAGIAYVASQTAVNLDSIYITCFNAEITAPSTFPAHVGVDDDLNLTATANPTGITGGTYAWSKASGPGNITFSSANSATTNFSADAAGLYTVACEFLAPGATDSYTVESGDIYVVDASLQGTSSLTRGNPGTYTMIISPSGTNATYNWKFTGESDTITEQTSSNVWSGVMVQSGAIECTAVFDDDTQITKTLTVEVNPRSWNMGFPPAAQEVTAPAWDDNLLGKGEIGFTWDDDMYGSPGYVSSGANKDLYYVLDGNYVASWQGNFEWWIVTTARTTSGAFWVKTQQEESYTYPQMNFYINCLIAHETDGSGPGTMGHRKIITEEIVGDLFYDPKAAVESLVSSESASHLGGLFTSKMNATSYDMQQYMQTGKNHPSWNGVSIDFWVTINGEFQGNVWKW